MRTKKGVVKGLDELGRLVIPKEIRRAMNITTGDLLELCIENGSIVISKFQDSCVICSSLEQLMPCKGKYICQACIERIQEM